MLRLSRDGSGAFLRARASRGWSAVNPGRGDGDGGDGRRSRRGAGSRVVFVRPRRRASRLRPPATRRGAGDPRGLGTQGTSRPSCLSLRLSLAAGRAAPAAAPAPSAPADRARPQRVLTPSPRPPGQLPSSARRAAGARGRPPTTRRPGSLALWLRGRRSDGGTGMPGPGGERGPLCGRRPLCAPRRSRGSPWTAPSSAHGR